MKSPVKTTSSSTDLGRDLLDLTEFITEEDIRSLREKICPEMHSTFDAETKDTKLILVALYRLGYEKLIALTRGGRPFSIVGTHDIKNRLTFILNAVPEIAEKWEKDK